MSRGKLEIPYLTDRYIEATAERFLAQAEPSGCIPVNIELIVEKQGFDIVPTPRLRADYDLDGCVNLSEKILYVDLLLMEQYEHRYRFTLAHEMGHVNLHPQLFSVMDRETRTIAAWMHRQRIVPDEIYSRADFQAHRFATFLLIPGEPLQRMAVVHLPAIKRRLTASIAAGAGAEAARAYALERLAELLAADFCVSRVAAEHRLRFAGYSTRTLFA